MSGVRPEGQFEGAQHRRGQSTRAQSEGAHAKQAEQSEPGEFSADGRSVPTSLSGLPTEPSVLVEQANRVFSALADPTRRQVLQLLSEIQPASASAISGHLPFSRQAIVQHLSVLQQSELVVSRRSGREVLFSLRPEALTQTASWMNTLAGIWSARLQRLKRLAEAVETAEVTEATDKQPGPGPGPGLDPEPQPTTPETAAETETQTR